MVQAPALLMRSAYSSHLLQGRLFAEHARRCRGVVGSSISCFTHGLGFHLDVKGGCDRGARIRFLRVSLCCPCPRYWDRGSSFMVGMTLCVVPSGEPVIRGFESCCDEPSQFSACGLWIRSRSVRSAEFRSRKKAPVVGNTLGSLLPCAVLIPGLILTFDASTVVNDLSKYRMFLAQQYGQNQDSN